jgi:putative redox protein
MATMTLTVTHTGSGNALDCATPDGPVLTFDSEGKHGASPMQHLLAAAGACALMDVDVILKKKRLAYQDLRVECHGARPDNVTPKPFLGVNLVFRVKGEVPVKAFEDAVRLSVEKYCSVGATLEKGIPVTWEAKLD